MVNVDGLSICSYCFCCCLGFVLFCFQRHTSKADSLMMAVDLKCGILWLKIVVSLPRDDLYVCMCVYIYIYI